MVRNIIRIASLTVCGVTLAVWVGAQTKEIPGDKVTVTATVEAIDHANRIVTLKGPQGNYVDVDVPPEAKRFDQIKVGDKVTATYYDNLVLRVQKPGEAPKNVGSSGVTRSQTGKPGLTASAQRTITVTIEAIDPKIPSITFRGPNGGRYSSRVEDKEALKQVKVGDKVDVTWTAALLISLEAPK
jgi:hypothetical protein